MLPEALGKKINDKNIPLSASFELTYQCNHFCTHCYQGASHQANDELSTQEARDIIRQLAEAGCLFLALTGGEPMLRHDFWEIIEYARRHNFAVSLQTNGTLIDATAAERLYELSVMQVHVSLLGARAKTHDTITGVPGSFDRAMDAVRLLRARNITVLLKATVLAENAAELEEMNVLAERTDAVPVFSPIVYPCQDCSSKPLTHRLEDGQLKAVFRFLQIKDKEAMVPPDKSGEDGLCLAAKSDCCISPHGKVYPCVGMPLCLGDLRHEPFASIWHGSEAARLMRRLKIKDWHECRDCEASDFCIRCPALAYLERGSLTSPSPETCRMAKLLKEVLQDGQEKEKIREAEVRC